jgi:hypothetical protein
VPTKPSLVPKSVVMVIMGMGHIQGTNKILIIQNYILFYGKKLFIRQLR